MNDENTNWTSIDLYYKGFHVKKSLSENVKVEELIKAIEVYIKAGFEPSWNSATSKEHLDAPKATTEPSKQVVDTNTPTCPIHHKLMVKRIGKFGEFYTCPTLLDDGKTWCPYKPEKKIKTSDDTNFGDY